MIEKRVFENVAEYEKFNKMYNDYLSKGLDSTKALNLTREAFCPSRKMSDECRKMYDDYIFKYGLSPEDAYILASRKNVEKSVESKKEDKKDNIPAVNSFFDDWVAPVKDWKDMLRPFNKFFDDSIFKEFGLPCWIDWWDKRDCQQQKRNGQRNGQCACKDREEEKSPAKPSKALDIVNDEIKKVLNSLPKDQVNDKTTKVDIVKNDPNDYEFKIDHTSADGKSHFHCTKKFYKSV